MNNYWTCILARRYDSLFMSNARTAIHRHVDAFNRAVGSGSFDEFVTTFANDAVMRFVGVPVGPFEGREAIRQAYRSNPPDDVMTLGEIVETDEGVRARFRWSAGGTGWMLLRWHNGLVVELVIEFDAVPSD
jgi:hypothetical protein